MSGEQTTVARLPRNKREHARVTVGEFKGKPRVDVRVYYIDVNGEEKPSKKGVSFPLDQVDGLLDAIGKARDLAKGEAA